jgi:hypothetical protein
VNFLPLIFLRVELQGALPVQASELSREKVPK